MVPFQTASFSSSEPRLRSLLKLVVGSACPLFVVCARDEHDTVNFVNFPRPFAQ